MIDILRIVGHAKWVRLTTKGNEHMKPLYERAVALWPGTWPTLAAFVKEIDEAMHRRRTIYVAQPHGWTMKPVAWSEMRDDGVYLLATVAPAMEYVVLQRGKFDRTKLPEKVAILELSRA